MSKTIVAINGVLIVYVMALVNSGLALLISFGVHLSVVQQGTIVTFVNAGLVMVAHAAHSAAKHTKSVMPAPPVDESHPDDVKAA